MDQAQITKWTRRGIREFKPDRVSDTEIENMTLEGVLYFSLLLKSLDPSLFRTEKVIQASAAGYIFDQPSDCLTIERLWDLKTTAFDISGAADNGSGLIRITTSDDHGFADADVVTIQDVGGCTEANGVWVIDYSSTTHGTTQFDLVGSAFANAYTSGGICYKRPQSPSLIKRINVEEATHSGIDEWYPRGTKIIHDNGSFSNDIICLYIKSPSAITDIPAEYHIGLVAFNVTNLISIPPRLRAGQPDDNVLEIQDKMASLRKHQAMQKETEEKMRESHQVSHEPVQITQEFSLDCEAES